MVYRLSILILKIIFFFLLDINVKGKENVPSEGAAILASNHISLMDAPLIAVTINRRLSAYAKKSVFNSRLKLWYLKSMGGIPVQTEKINRELITKTKQIFDSGKMLIVFPEGKIYHNGEPGEFKDGFLRIAVQFKVPIIPVTIKGTEKSLGKGQKFPRPAKVEIIYGEPLKFNNVDGRFTKEEIQQAIDEVKKRIKKT